MMAATLPRRSFRGVLFAASVLLAACGGGGETAGVDSGGTGSFAIGPITGFGSVIVNEIRYDDTTAAVLDDDGAARSTADLKLGMVVEIEGSALTAAPAGSAFERQGLAGIIRFGAEVVGPLQSVDAAVSRITVFGQVLDVTPSTVYGDGLAGGIQALAAKAPGTVLEIHGYLNPANTDAAGNGRYTATRIDLNAGASEFRLHGAVRDLDTANRRFRIGTTRIDYAALDAEQARGAGIVDGAQIRVRLGNTARDDGSWPMLTGRTDARSLPDRDDVDIEGLITAFSSPTAFSVSGVPVDASGAEFDDGRSRLALGVRVEVEGRLRGGVLIADEVEIEDDGAPSGGGGGSGSGGAPQVRRISLSGAVESVDPAQQVFRLRGLTVRYAAATFDDGSAGDLRPGARVEVDGRLSADGSTIDAIEIEFDD